MKLPRHTPAPRGPHAILPAALPAALCALTLCALTLSACASPQPGPAPAPGPPGSAAPTASVALPATALTATARAAATPVAATATPAPRTLTLWAAEEGPALAAVQAIAADFTAKAGLPIHVVARPPDGLRLSLATAALSGDPPPDLLWGDSEALAGLIADGRIQPLAPEAMPDDALPALRTAATADGEVWGVPVAASGSLLVLANRALVDRLPGTSDELIAWARDAETAEVAGLVQAWDEARWVLPWLYAFGGAPTSPDGQTITLDTPAMTPTLNLLRELYRAAPDDGAGYARGRRLFAQGYAALAIDGDWSLAAYRAVSDTLDLGIAPLPVVPATGRAAAPTLGGTYLMLASDLAGGPRASGLAFGAFLTRPATQARLARDLGRLPATLTALAAPVKPWAADPALAAAAAHASEAPGLPPTKAARCALYGIDVWLPSLLGSLDLVDAPAAMQQEAEACLARGP